MSRSFLFGVLIDVFRTVVQSDAVVEGTSVTSDNCAANLEEARAKADVAPNVARTAASTIIEMNCFMDVPPLPFNGFLFLVNCLVCPVQSTLRLAGLRVIPDIRHLAPSPPFHSFHRW